MRRAATNCCASTTIRARATTGIETALSAGKGQSGEPDFLSPDEAFHFSALADGPDKIRLIWGITDGYYLYRARIKASSDGDWSETYICNLFDWHLKEQETMPWLTGAELGP